MSVRVIDCVAEVLTTTLPNPTLAALMLNVPTDALNCRAKLLEVRLRTAVNVTVCEFATEDTSAVKPALVAFAGTVTVAGMMTAVLLLDRFTLTPPTGAAADNVTVQAFCAEPVADAMLHVSAFNDRL
jgi:hypothetical protein